MEGSELESRFLEAFIPEDHYALRQREFSTRIATPASPLNSALLNSETLGQEDGLALIPANPLEDLSLPRTVSVTSIHVLESGVPSAETLLKEVRNVVLLSGTSKQSPVPHSFSAHVRWCLRFPDLHTGVGS